MSDIGSLHGDLTELALALAAYRNEPVGRRISGMLVINSRPQAADPSTRGHFGNIRREMVEDISAAPRNERIARRRQIFRRAATPDVAIAHVHAVLE